MTKPKPNKYTQELGKNIRFCRRSREIKVNELAKAVNRCRDTVRRYEAGLMNPMPETLQKIADYFGVSINRLLPISDKRKQNN